MSDADYLLHQFPVSPFAAKVRRVFHYKQITFATRNYRLTEMGAVRKVSPSGKLPALEIDGRIIVDSTDIVQEIEQRSPERPILPADPSLRAQAHIYEDWADESLYFYDLAMRTWPNNVQLLADDLCVEEKPLSRAIFHRLIPGAIKKQAKGQGLGRKTVDEVCRDVSRHFDALETMLEGKDWLLGNSISNADISVASMCTVMERAEEAREMMLKRDKLTAWRARVDACTLPPDTPPEQRAFV